MDQLEFEAILARGEGPTLDFKTTDYDLGNEPLKGNFVKDVLSFLNTPREGNAHIILGVKRLTDGSNDLRGVAGLKDDNEYQQVLKCIDPTPVLDFSVFEYKGLLFGIVRISSSRRGPFCSTKDVGPVKKGVLYWRQGSMNTEAASMADQRAIHKWAGESDELAPPVADGASDDWARLLSGTDSFATGTLSVLVTWGLSMPDRGRVAGIGRANWLAVIDFDTMSMVDGLASEAVSVLKEHRVVHEVIIGDRPTVHSANATYWYYARGLDGRATSLVSGGLRNWRMKYPRDLRAFLDSLATGTDLAPVHVICLLPEGGEVAGAPYVATTLSLFTEAFADRASFHLCSCDSAAVATVAAEHECGVYCLRPQDFARGISHRFAASGGQGIEEYSLPARGGVAQKLAVKDRLWIEEELEPVYLSSGLVAAGPTDRDFLNGGLPAWPNLALHDDVDRDIAPKLAKQLRQDLGLTQAHSSGTVRVNLYHEPGVGGSTLARRILWEIHREVPSVILRRPTPAETTERIRLLYNACSLPVLIMAEGSEITDTAAEDIYTHLKSQQVPAVILRVLRSFQAPMTVSGRDGSTRVFYLPPALSQVESAGFAERFSRAAPARRSDLHRLSVGHDGNRHPFFFGLIAFGDDFKGLTGFVRARLEAATEAQRDMLAFLAFSYYYGQKGLSAQSFASLLGVPANRLVDLSQALNAQQRQLLRADGHTWRPVHQLVAAEVLRQSLDPQMSDREVWRQNLAPWAFRFAKFCRGEQEVISVDMMDVVSRCFLLRDSRELIGREDASAFSRLIEDIPSLEARFNLLESLTQLFPEEPHVWAHAGRFAFQKMKNPTRAREFIDRGIQLSPDDHVLYHIKGMAFRSECYDLMDRVRAAGRLANPEELKILIRNASEQFEAARLRAPDDEHGYISHVQMLIRVVDSLRAISGGKTVETLAGLPTFGALIRQSVDEADSLLEQVRANREGERASEYAVRCGAQLDDLFGNYQAVLQAWDGLLSRSDVYKPPVRRQLVRAYLARRDRRWQELTQKEIQRSVDLLQSNLLEEPGEEQNIRLWVQAVRRLVPVPGMGQLLERVAYWRANSESVDPAYYFYVLHAVEALAGSPLSCQALDAAVKECRNRASMRRNRNWSFEWLGPGSGVNQLVHHSELGGWDDASDFWAQRALLFRMRGRVSKIAGPEAGFIELPHGVSAFFVPGRAGIVASRDENRLVELFVGFTYDGLRGWEVRPVDETEATEG